eukprot:436264_1
MGNICSATCCTADICNCFTYDKNVQKLLVTRNIKSKWHWTSDHEQILLETLSDSSYDVPVEITLTIKDYAYSSSIHHYVNVPTIYQEHYYAKQKKLLKKTLCNSWYKSQVSNVSMLTINLYTSNKIRLHEQQEIFKSFNTNHLPALKPSYKFNDAYVCMDAMRTVNIDNCSTRIHLQLFNKDRHFQDDNFCFIMFKESDCMLDIDAMCNNVSQIRPTMNNCILVEMIENKNRKCSKNNKECEMSKKWNIPLLGVNVNDEQSVKDLFILAIKYRWFFDVIH